MGTQNAGVICFARDKLCKSRQMTPRYGWMLRKDLQILVLVHWRAELCNFFFQAEDVIRDGHVTGVQTCALPISSFKTQPNTFSCASCGRRERVRDNHE